MSFIQLQWLLSCNVGKEPIAKCRRHATRCNPRADKWYTLVWYYVCPAALLKVTKLYPCLSYFPGFFGHFESLAFSEMVDKPYTKAVKQDTFSKFFQSITEVTIFSKKAQLFWLKCEDKPNNRYIEDFSTKYYVFVEKIVVFQTDSWGQRWLQWWVDDQNYDYNKWNWYGCLLFSEERNVQKPWLFI